MDLTKCYIFERLPHPSWIHRSATSLIHRLLQIHNIHRIGTYLKGGPRPPIVAQGALAAPLRLDWALVLFNSTICWINCNISASCKRERVLDGWCDSGFSAIFDQPSNQREASQYLHTLHTLTGLMGFQLLRNIWPVKGTKQVVLQFCLSDSSVRVKSELSL